MKTRAARAGGSGLQDNRLPVCVLPDGTPLYCPTIRQIAERLGWFRDPSRAQDDLAIYRAGPAGLSAAVYGAPEGLATVLIERYAVGRQAASRPANSGRRSCSGVKACAANSSRERASAIWLTGPELSPGRQSAPLVSNTGG